MGRNVRYSVIVPMYNEEDVIEETYRRLKKVMNQTNDSYELLFVNDGSRIGAPILSENVPNGIKPLS